MRYSVDLPNILQIQNSSVINDLLATTVSYPKNAMHTICLSFECKQTQSCSYELS